MKNLKVWLVILPMLTTACSDEYTGEASTAQVTVSAKKSAIGPANPSNPYDSAGSIHNEILDALDETDFNPQSIADIAFVVDSLSSLYPGLEPLPANSSLSTRLVEIASVANSNDALNEVLTESPMGADARNSLSAFVNSLVLSADDPYESIHSEIVSYEEGILANSGFSSEDKRIILTTTSVVRYSASKKKRKDKDWETSVTSIAATVSGAGQCLALGLKMAVTVGLCKNDNITQ